MMGAPLESLKRRAQRLARSIRQAAPTATAHVQQSVTFLGSGSLPAEPIPSYRVELALPGLGAAALARRLRLDPSCIFSRIEEDRVRLDTRTIRDSEIKAIAQAIGRISS